MAKKETSSIVLRIYLLAKSRPGKEEGIIEIRGSNKQKHFDKLDYIPDKIRDLLSDTGVKWPPRPNTLK